MLTNCGAREDSCSAAAAAAKLLQPCLTLCDPIDGSPPGSPVPGILQARTLEWVSISFSNAWKWSHSVVSDPQRPHGLQPSRLLHPWDFPGKSTGVGCHCLLLDPLKSPKGPAFWETETKTMWKVCFFPATYFHQDNKIKVTFLLNGQKRKGGGDEIHEEENFWKFLTLTSENIF